MSIQSNLNNMLLVGAGGAGAYFTKGAGVPLRESNLAKKDLKRMGADEQGNPIAGSYYDITTNNPALLSGDSDTVTAAMQMANTADERVIKNLEKIQQYKPTKEMAQTIAEKSGDLRYNVENTETPTISTVKKAAAAPKEDKKAETEVAPEAAPETPEVLAYAKAASQGPDTFDENRSTYTNTPYDVDDPWEVAAEQALRDSVKNSTEQQKAMEMRAQILGKQMEDWGRANIGTTWDRGIQDYKNYGQLLGQWDKAFKTARREGGKV